MFIFNVKVNSNLWFKTLMIFIGIIIFIIFIYSIYKVFFTQQEDVLTINDEVKHSDITEIMPNDYTNILKTVHENLDEYIGKKIKFSGYVYRVIDFNEKQFVLARDMLIDSESYVVGFLSEYDKIKDFADGSWVELTGEITKGKYHNKEIPIIKVVSLNKIEKPADEFVLPPSDTFIPTSALL